MKAYFKYKSDIAGLGDVSETIKATEKISAAKIHSLKVGVKQLNEYIFELERVLMRVSQFYFDEKNIFLKKGHQKEKAVVLVTSNKGLVGGLYHNLVNFLINDLDKYDFTVVIGKKGVKYLKEDEVALDKTFLNLSEYVKHDEVSEIADYIFNLFESKGLNNVDLIYPEFISLSSQKPKLIEFLPFEFKTDKEKSEPSSDTLGFPVFEQSKKEVFKYCIKKYISVFFFKIILESKLSELSARMVATEHASEKVKEIIGKLSVSYFKERKKFITKTQIESFVVHKVK